MKAYQKLPYAPRPTHTTTVLSGMKNTCFMTLENQIQELLRSLTGGGEESRVQSKCQAIIFLLPAYAENILR